MGLLSSTLELQGHFATVARRPPWHVQDEELGKDVCAVARAGHAGRLKIWLSPVMSVKPVRQHLLPLPCTLGIWPTHPWSHIRLDYAGPIDGEMFLMLVDAHSIKVY